MSQSRRASACEALANWVIGTAVSAALTMVIFDTGPGQGLAVSLAFSGASLIRAYVLRRVFARLDGRGPAQGRPSFRWWRGGASG